MFWVAGLLLINPSPSFMDSPPQVAIFIGLKRGTLDVVVTVVWRKAGKRDRIPHPHRGQNVSFHPQLFYETNRQTSAVLFHPQKQLLRVVLCREQGCVCASTRVCVCVRMCFGKALKTCRDLTCYSDSFPLNLYCVPFLST